MPVVLAVLVQTSSMLCRYTVGTKLLRNCPYLLCSSRLSNRIVLNPQYFCQHFSSCTTRPTSQTSSSTGKNSASSSRIGSLRNTQVTQLRGMASLSDLDETQVKLLAEECIVVDRDDKIIGSASKKNCHLNENIAKGLLHRAFSVFLFNSQGQLLLQQRSDAKITFPGFWANTCCSHPLNFPEEMEEANNLGVRRAAQRKLQHELGIRPQQVPVDDFHYLTRIQYQAESDEKWGEHEIDHILFIQKDVDVTPEPNEVQHIKYISPDELSGFLRSSETDGIKISPWFNLIARTFLPDWWKLLDNVQCLKDHGTIHRM